MKNEFLSKVFRWFGVGLLVTFLVAYFVSTNVALLSFIFTGATYWILFLVEIILAIWLSTRIRLMESGLAKVLYFVYCGLTGLTFSSIFVVYELESIIWIFLVTAIVFMLVSFLGNSTKIDMSKFGIYLAISLLGIIILELINIFLRNQSLNMTLCIVSILVFIGYIAYDIQKILRSYDETDNMAIIGAFDLYLDFINLLLRLLQLFGKEKD